MRTAQPHHRWLLAERSTNWKKTALNYPLNPTPSTWALQFALTRGTSRNIRVLPRWWRGGKQGIGHVFPAYSPFSVVLVCPSTIDKSWGEQLGEEGDFLPLQKGIGGRGRGEGGSRIQRKAECLGKVVALIQNPAPFKGPREAALGLPGAEQTEARTLCKHTYCPQPQPPHTHLHMGFPASVQLSFSQGTKRILVHREGMVLRIRAANSSNDKEEMRRVLGGPVVKITAGPRI